MKSSDELDQRQVKEDEEILETEDGDEALVQMSFTSKLYEIVSEERNREIVSWHRGMI